MIRSEGSRLIDVSLARRINRPLDTGLSLTRRTGGGRGDICEFVSATDTRCRARVPSQSQLSVLLGAGASYDGVDLRAFVGPSVAFGEGRPFVGGTVGAEVALGGDPVGFVAGYRRTSLRNSASENQHYGAYHIGVRFGFRP
ncbi:MAG: hypothetical protein IBJ03_07555 [Gemmatimonadaceae bacterium]|nr:hypothetical protein [Gemmatimonadaceae bacterium]